MSDPLGLINDSPVDPLGLLNPIPKNQLVTSLSSDKPTAIRMPRPDDEPDDGIFGMIRNVFPDSPFSEKASAQNAVQVARELGIAPSMVTKDVMNKYAQKKGAYTQPENKDFMSKILLAPVAAGLLTHPLATVLGLTVFGGLAEAENFAVSKAKDEPYQFGAGKGLADLTKEGTSETVKDVLWLADMTWQAIAAGGAVKGASMGADKFAEKFMRDTVTKYNMPRSVFISPEKIREFHGLGREDVITPEETSLLKDINLTRSDYVNAVKNGIDIEIPSEKLVTIKDKPWVKAVKDFFKVSPYEETTIVPAGDAKAKAPVSGLIEGQTQRREFKDILNDIKSVFTEERGSISGENLPPEKVEAMDRLKKDFEVLKKEAEGAGKEVFKYMVENGIDEKSATYMMKIGGTDETKIKEPESSDDVNELLSMAARQDKAAGDLTENPSYDAIRQKASQLAFEKIQKKIDFQKRKEAAALRRQGEDTARLLPVYKAMDHIISSGGISKKSLLADYDKETVTEIMRKRPGLVSPNGTMGPDVYADQHGFESGGDLINAILDWQGVKKEGAAAADEFTRNYGDLISKAESNDYHIALLEEEERILTQLLKGNAPKPAKGLKDFIRKETGQVPVETLMVSEYEALTAAMKKAEQASRKAFSSGNITGALKEKQRQKELALEKKARLEAKQEAKDIHDGIIKIMNDNNLPDDYKDKIGDFLSDYDLYPRSSKGAAQVESTREFLERMEIQGEDVDIPKSVLSKVERYGRVHWREMSLDQLRDIYDQAKMLSHLGKLKSKLIAAKEARDYETVISGIVNNIKKNWPGINAEPTPAEVENMLLDKSTWQAAKDKISAYQAELTKPEYIFRRLDRWQDLGPAWESFYKPIQDAYNQEVTDLAPIIKALQTMFEPFTKAHAGKWAREKYKIPGVPQILTKEKMIMVALNTGNDGNLTALKEGYNWTDEQVRAITDKLDAKEWRLVQDVWSLYKTMFPKLADVYNKLTGSDLVPVEGNYHPLVFDRSLSWIADKNASEAEMKDFFKTIYAKPNVTTGAVIERKGGKLPPKLSFNVIFNHVADVNHYISHALPVRDVQKLLSDPRVRSAIETAPDGIGGAESYNQLMPWLQNVAKPKVDPMSITESILKTIRRNTTTVALGLKFSVAEMQWLGMTQSIEAVGHNQFVKGFLDFYTHRGDMVDAIKEKSPEMANRAQSWDRELNDAYGRLGIENFKGSQAIKDAYFSLISLMDMAVAYPTWQAAFDQGMKQFNGDESKAVYYADMKVRNSQGNALAKDMAGIQRGSELKKFVTMFYTFFSSMQNQLAEVNTKFKNGEKNVFELMKSWWWIVVAPALLGYVMRERKAPTPKEAVKEVIQYRLGGYPVLRDIASPVFSDFDYQFSPAARFGEVAGKALSETTKMFTEDRDFEKFLQYSIESAGYIKGLPTGQALITIKGFNDLKNGETSDLTRLLFRAPREDDEE